MMYFARLAKILMICRNLIVCVKNEYYFEREIPSSKLNIYWKLMMHRIYEPLQMVCPNTHATVNMKCRDSRPKRRIESWLSNKQWDSIQRTLRALVTSSLSLFPLGITVTLQNNFQFSNNTREEIKIILWYENKDLLHSFVYQRTFLSSRMPKYANLYQCTQLKCVIQKFIIAHIRMQYTQ